jgi:hypothetical protein
MTAGFGGATCEEAYEPFCLNQCNGRGQCKLGFCKCDKGEVQMSCTACSGAFQRPYIVACLCRLARD